MEIMKQIDQDLLNLITAMLEKGIKGLNTKQKGLLMYVTGSPVIEIQTEETLKEENKADKKAKKINKKKSDKKTDKKKEEKKPDPEPEEEIKTNSDSLLDKADEDDLDELFNTEQVTSDTEPDEVTNELGSNEIESNWMNLLDDDDDDE